MRVAPLTGIARLADGGMAVLAWTGGSLPLCPDDRPGRNMYFAES